MTSDASPIQVALQSTTTTETTGAMALIKLAGMIKAASSVHDSLFLRKGYRSTARKKMHELKNETEKKLCPHWNN